jgi:hypothetical protein
VGESRWLAGLDESEKVKKLAGWPYNDPAGSTNAVRWDVSLGAGATVSAIKSMPAFHQINPSLPQSVELGQQLRFPLIEFDRPSSAPSNGWSGVDLRIFLEPLRIPAIRTLPNETDMTNYVAARGLLGSVDEALARIRESEGKNSGKE